MLDREKTPWYLCPVLFNLSVISAAICVILLAVIIITIPQIFLTLWICFLLVLKVNTKILLVSVISAIHALKSHSFMISNLFLSVRDLCCFSPPVALFYAPNIWSRWSVLNYILCRIKCRLMHSTWLSHDRETLLKLVRLRQRYTRRSSFVFELFSHLFIAITLWISLLTKKWMAL